MTKYFHILRDLNEIINNLIKLKIQKISNPKDTEIDKKLKTLMGKSLNDEQFKEIILLKDNDLRLRISDQFNKNREKESKF